MMRKWWWLIAGGLLLMTAACAPRSEPLERVPLEQGGEAVATQELAAYPAPEQPETGSMGEGMSVPGGMPAMESRAQVVLQVVAILPPTHPQAKHLVRAQLLSLNTMEGMASMPVAQGATIEAHTKEDLSAFQAGDTLQAVLRYAGDENGTAYWLLNVQPAAYP